jgi:hypothetical protein
MLVCWLLVWRAKYKVSWSSREIVVQRVKAVKIAPPPPRSKTYKVRVWYSKGCPNKNARFERVITFLCVVLSCPIFDRLIVNISKLVTMQSKTVQQRVSITKSTNFNYHFCASIFLVVIVSFSVSVTRNGLDDHVILPP